MSFENKGSMPVAAYVTVAPDRSGNYVCDAAVESHEITIQRAIDDLTAGRANKEVVLLHGEFDINDIITVPSRTIINMEQAYLQLTADVNSVFAPEGASYVSWVEFIGGHIDGDRGGGRTDGSAIYGAWRDLEIKGVRITDFYEYGIHSKPVSGSNNVRWRIDKCMIGGPATGDVNRLGGLYFDNTSNNGANDCQITNNYFIRNGAFQIKADVNSTDMRIIGGNHFVAQRVGSDAHGRGVFLEGDIKRWQINDNHFENTDMEAILIQPLGGDFSDHNTIIGNTFRDTCIRTDDTYDTIMADSVTGGDTRLGVISGNTFMSATGNKPRYAIHLEGAATDYWTVSANTIHSNAYVSGAIQNIDAANNELDGDNAII